MNRINEIITQEKKFKKQKKVLRAFSPVYLLAGEEYNQELACGFQGTINLLDFAQLNQESPQFLEKKIKEIYQNSLNQKLINQGDFPVIVFKNIEKIKNSALEESLLPIFDPHQNSQLFNQEVDLSQFILLATTSSYQIEQISDPLISRLELVNVETAQSKRLFLDKYYPYFLGFLLLANLVLGLLLIFPKLVRNTINNISKNE